MTDLNQKLAEFVSQVVGAMGLSLEVTVEQLADGVRVNLQGADGDTLIQRKGEALDALQHIVSTAFRRQMGDGERIAVDCLDYRKDKDAELRKMAQFLMQKAKETGVAQEIGPLNPYARRIVHLAVAEDPTVESESIGDAFMKTVIITARK